jgi:nucleotide-binding universal stress UspA family protein
MSSPSTPSSILVDLALPDPAPPHTDLVELLASLRVVLVGWYWVPEQTSPEQAREQFEEEATAALNAVAAPFRSAGADVETRLVFTGNELDTISRISTEEQVDAVLIAGPLDRLKHILVPLRGQHNANRIATFVADLVKNPDAEVTLLHVLEEDETEASVRRDVLEPIAALMTDRGIEAEAIYFDVVSSASPGDTIVEQSANFDLVVLGETKPTIRDILFGSVPEQIAQYAHVPVLIVRHGREDVEVAERASVE